MFVIVIVIFYFFRVLQIEIFQFESKDMIDCILYIILIQNFK